MPITTQKYANYLPFSVTGTGEWNTGKYMLLSSIWYFHSAGGGVSSVVNSSFVRLAAKSVRGSL